MQRQRFGGAAQFGAGFAQPVDRHADFKLPGWIALFLGSHCLDHLQRRCQCRFGFGITRLTIQQQTQIALGVRPLHLPFGLLGIERHQLIGQPLVFAELRFGFLRIAAFIGDIADPEHALRMIEYPLGIAGIARQQFTGGRRRLPESFQSADAVPPNIAHLADQMQRARTPSQRIGVEISGPLPGIIFERALTDHIQRVEPAHRLQLGAQIGEHEFHQSVSLGPLVIGLNPRLHRHPGHAAHHQRQCQRGPGDDPRPQRPAPVIAIYQFVQPDAEHGGCQLEPGAALAIAAAARIGGQRGIARNVCDREIFGNVVGQRLGKTLRLGAARLAIDDQRQYLGWIAVGLEPGDFTVDPFRLGRAR